MKGNRKKSSTGLLSNAPLIGAAATLVFLALLAATPAIISALALYQGEATSEQTLFLICSASLVSLTMLTINHLVRTAAIEKSVHGIPQQSTAMKALLEDLSLQISSLNRKVQELQTPKSEELIRDTDKLWSQLCGGTTMFSPTLKNEVWLVGGTTNSMRRFEFSKSRVSMFANRIRQGDLEIVIPAGVINRQAPDSNVLHLERDRHDLDLALKIAKLLHEVQKTGSVDMSRVKIYFASESDPEQRSVFLSHLEEDGALQPIVLIYGKGWDPLTHDVNRRVAMLRDKSDVNYFRSLVSNYRNRGTRWTVEQLLSKLSGYFPLDNEAVPAPPVSFPFDPDDPYSTAGEFDVIDSGDGSFTFKNDRFKCESENECTNSSKIGVPKEKKF